MLKSGRYTTEEDCYLHALIVSFPPGNKMLDQWPFSFNSERPFLIILLGFRDTTHFVPAYNLEMQLAREGSQISIFVLLPLLSVDKYM